MSEIEYSERGFARTKPVKCAYGGEFLPTNPARLQDLASG